MTSIHKEFHAVLNGYIARRVSNTADAEDLLQEVFIKIHRNIAALNRQESLRSWLFKIARNTIIDYYRRNASVKHVYDEQTLLRLTDENEEFDKTRSLENCIHRFISELPEEYREIIMDAEINGIRQKDLAEKYQLAYPSVRSRVQRGRAKLKEKFLACCKIELDRRGNILSAVPRSDKCL